MFVVSRADEVPLSGGDVTEGVVRVGDTVRRPLKATSSAVHALLRHLESVGFDAAPRVLGIDELGREVLTFVPGDVPGRPFPAGENVLAELAGLQRRYHDAVAGFRPKPGATWEEGSVDDVEPEVVGHCDITPENVVFRDGLPVALIDFDMARPVSRLFDVVTTLRHWAPIADPLDRDHPDLDTGRRIRLFADAYGLSAAERLRLIPTARLRFDRSYAAMKRKAETDGGGWAVMWESGAGQRIRRAAAWLDANEDVLHRFLQ
ncbi:phosphotransferase [Herbidospora mongoliensis]|uniref:phosphotransferase n=1 Tax=Herbidospora mongoliensis TaxID=688067 RepID=UPI000830E5C4|nr:phosphotransferase [Herbidospora mongoliensis]